jgi:hypothetical protein
VSSLDFLSPSRCAPGTAVSPLRRALDTVSDTVSTGTDSSGLVEDLSLSGKVELRGDLDRVDVAGELVRLSPRRGFLFTDEDPADVVERVRAAGVLAYDATGALAGFAVSGERLMRRLTDLDLGRLPAAGPFAGVPAIVVRGDGGERFRIYVAQEVAHDVAHAVLDAAEGLE